MGGRPPRGLRRVRGGVKDTLLISFWFLVDCTAVEGLCEGTLRHILLSHVVTQGLTLRKVGLDAYHQRISESCEWRVFALISNLRGNQKPAYSIVTERVLRLGRLSQPPV